MAHRAASCKLGSLPTFSALPQQFAVICTTKCKGSGLDGTVFNGDLERRDKKATSVGRRHATRQRAPTLKKFEKIFPAPLANIHVSFVSDVAHG
ncbi:hypothetical protein ACSQ76_21915 [Roseovarius sp. B08]|uniref:hypothetical protein n=1 Tax=Roseovarius sp. B08 TaxID=3449223 RepID=UPI003EDBB3D3